MKTCYAHTPPFDLKGPSTLTLENPFLFQKSLPILSLIPSSVIVLNFHSLPCYHCKLRGQNLNLSSHVEHFNYWLLHPFLVLPFQSRVRSHLHSCSRGYLGDHLTSRKHTPKAPTIILCAKLVCSCICFCQPHLCSDLAVCFLSVHIINLSSLRTGDAKAAK